jgi:hypothetical protein
MKTTLRALSASFLLTIFSLPVFAAGGGSNPFTIGPKVSLAVPIPLRVGVEAKWQNMIGGSFDYGVLPSLTFNDVSIKGNNWNLAARFYPFMESFFVGLGFGKQSLKGSKVDTINGQSVTATADYSQTIIIPHIGWRRVFAGGFFFGTELGVQLPLSKAFEVTTDRQDLETGFATEMTALKNQANAEADKYGDIPLPWVTLIQFGFFL